MKVRYINQSDICWQAEVKLNDSEWPKTDDYGDWLDRPIRQWVIDNFSWSDAFFSARGSIYFRNRLDAEWFHLTWESSE